MSTHSKIQSVFTLDRLGSLGLVTRVVCWNICFTTTPWPPFDDTSHRRFALLASKQHWPTITCCSLYVLFTNTVPIEILVCTPEAESLRLQSSTSGVEMKIWQQCYILPPEMGFAPSHGGQGQGSWNHSQTVFSINCKALKASSSPVYKTEFSCVNNFFYSFLNPFVEETPNYNYL